MNTFLNNRTFQVVFLLFAAILIFLGRQLDVGLRNFDDSYYAQKSKEMLSTSNPWVVQYDGEPAFDNPPFPFWMTALAYKIFGVSGYAAVFFSGVFGISTVLLTYALAFYLFRSRWIAFFAAFVLLFPGIFVDAGRRGMVDMPLAFCVTAALFGFARSFEDKKYYLLYGLMTSLAILTKSVLGFFPLVIGFVYLAWTRQWREFVNPFFLGGLAIVLLFGLSWYLVNWVKFGDEFLRVHFGVLIFQRGFSGTKSVWDFLGYADDFLKNYWPWLPVALVGIVKFSRRFVVEKDRACGLVLLWFAIIFLVMSTSVNQTLRYILMVFPALAIMVSKTVSDWLSEPGREKLLPWVVGSVMLTVIGVNATPIQARVTLKPNSVDLRQLAPLIHLNTPPGQKVGNYRLSNWNPRSALLFYSNRSLDDSVRDPEKLIALMEQRPRSTWLSPITLFKELQDRFPGKFYLIHGNRKYAYFTSAENRENIQYDFSGMRVPVVR